VARLINASTKGESKKGRNTSDTGKKRREPTEWPNDTRASRGKRGARGFLFSFGEGGLYRQAKGGMQRGRLLKSESTPEYLRMESPSFYQCLKNRSVEEGALQKRGAIGETENKSGPQLVD